MAGVVLENVSRVFPGGVTAVDRVSLEVIDKEFLVLVGPSGCGKSTTLRMIAGLEEISSGRITIGARVVNDVPPKDRDIAMVFQNYALYPHMSVYKNLAFGLELRYGGSRLRQMLLRVVWPRKAAEMARRRYGIAEQVRGTAQNLGIEHLLERMPRQLSGGERQRVALGRAIVRQPAAFLFDEPLSNLDAKLRVEMRRELKQLHQRLETTMIFVTHDQVEALTLGQRIAVMDRGALQQLGSPADVYDRPRNQFVAGFIGTPPMNFVTGRLIQSNGSWSLRHAAASISLAGVPDGIEPTDALARIAGRQVTLGVRPEDVSLAGGAPADSAPPGSLAGRVTLVEPLGDATVVTLAIGEAQNARESLTLVSKIGPRAAVRPGDRASVLLDSQRVHLFDSATGENLSAAGGANQG
jgi:multiple sugar transport system ATP-binding protein